MVTFSEFGCFLFLRKARFIRPHHAKVTAKLDRDRSGSQSQHHSIARHNSRYVRQGQPINIATGLLAVVPEAGVSYWLTSSARLNAGASYYIADGRPNFLVFGLSMEFLSENSFCFSSREKSNVPSVFRSSPVRRSTLSTIDESPNPYFDDAAELVDPDQFIHALLARPAENNTCVPIIKSTNFHIETSELKRPPNDLPAPLTSASNLFGTVSSPNLFPQSGSL